MENNSLTVEEASKMFEDLPQSKEDLDIYFRYYYGIYLASQTIEEGNSSPLDFAWDIFTSMMGMKINVELEDYNILGIACRSGQKSLTCAAIELLALTFDRWRDYFHMASIYDQSKVTYGYVQGVLNKPYVKDVAIKTIMSETISRFKRQLKIGTGTIRAVNSFHGSIIQDEVDLTDKKVFIESKGMLSPAMGKSPLNICISSRKYAFGNIQEMINKKKKDVNYPLRIHRWGQLEITQYCDKERSGEQNTSLYADEDDLVALSDKEYSQLNLEKRERYVKYSAYENCYKCGIFSFCLGRLKNQKRDNPFLQSIDDVRRLFFTDDPEFFKAQRLNKKPSSSGLVYPMFDPSIHFISYDRMHEIFMGEKYDGDVELDIKVMIELFEKHNCKRFLGVDFGFNMALALLGVVDGKDNIYILDELVAQYKSDAEFALETHHRWGHLGISKMFPDIESPGAIKEFKKYFSVVNTDHPPYSKISKDVKWGIGLVRKHLRVPGSRKESKLFIHNSCVESGEEMQVYRLKIDPELDEPTDTIRKKRDHAMDGLRYLVVGILGMIKMKYIMVEDAKPSLDYSPIGYDKHLPQSAPTADEMALYTGHIGFADNSSEFEEEDGKLKRKEVGGGKVKFALA